MQRTSTAVLAIVLGLVMTAGDALATPACDDSCPYPEDGVILAPQDGATVPRNFRVLMRPPTEHLRIHVSGGGPFTQMTKTTAVSGLEWYELAEPLEPRTTYDILRDDNSVLMTVTTNDDIDEDAPEVLDANVALADAGCVQVVTAAPTATENLSATEVTYQGPQGETVVVGGGDFATRCRFGDGSEALVGEVVVYDLAGNPSAPLAFTADPPPPSEDGGGCTMSSGATDSPWASWMTLLALFGATRRRARRQAS